MILVISLGIVILIIYYIIRYRRRRIPDNTDEPSAINSRSIIKVQDDPCLNGVIYHRGDDLCIWGHPNPVPESDIERSRSEYNGGSIKINGHPFLYHSNGFLKIHRPWWQFSRILFISEGYDIHSGYYFIQTHSGLYYASATSTIHLTEEVYDQLIFYEKVPHLIRDGSLYRCPTSLTFNTAYFVLRTHRWDVEVVNFIGGFDIRFMDIVDMSCASNEELILVTSSGRILYIPTSSDSDLINSRSLKNVLRGTSRYHNPFSGIKLDLRPNIKKVITPLTNHNWRSLPIHRILLGESSETFIVFYNHSISIIDSNRIKMSLNGVSKAIWGSSKNIIYTIDLCGTVSEYDIKIGDASRRILCHHMKDVDHHDGILMLRSNDNIICNVS